MEFKFESPAAGRTKNSFALKTQNHLSSSVLSVCHPARKVSFNCGNSFDREGQAGLASVCVCSGSRHWDFPGWQQRGIFRSRARERRDGWRQLPCRSAGRQRGGRTLSWLRLSLILAVNPGCNRVAALGLWSWLASLPLSSDRRGGKPPHHLCLIDPQLVSNFPPADGNSI